MWADLELVKCWAESMTRQSLKKFCINIFRRRKPVLGKPGKAEKKKSRPKKRKKEVLLLVEICC